MVSYARLLASTVSILLFAVPNVTVLAADPIHRWSHSFGSIYSDEGLAVAVDPSGNVVMTGVFHETVSFGGSPLTSAGRYDAFVAKYNADGVHQWSRHFGDVEHDDGLSIAFDAAGNVIVVGYFHGTVDLGGGPLVSAGQSDIFLAKYNGDGVYQWGKRVGGI